MRFWLLACLLLTATACQKGDAVLKAPAADGPRDKSAKLTETATPNKPVSQEAADVEAADLETLKKELNALNSDLSRMRQDLTQTDAARVVPDDSISTRRALATNGVVDIPDSKPELAAPIIEREEAREQAPAAIELGSTTATITGVRVGAHPDKTRLVFDIEGDLRRDPSVNIAGNILKINAFATDWPGSTAQFSSLEGSLGVFNVVREKEGTVVNITFDHPVSLKSHSVLPPAVPGGPKRLVIDLTPAS